MIRKLIAGFGAVAMALGSRHFDLELSPQQVKTLSSPWCRVLALVLMAYAATGQVWLSIAIGMFIYAIVYHFLHERSVHHYRNWDLYDIFDEKVYEDGKQRGQQRAMTRNISHSHKRI